MEKPVSKRNRQDRRTRVKKMKDRTQKKHCSDVVPDGVFLL